MQRFHSASGQTWWCGELPPEAESVLTTEAQQEQLAELTMVCAVYPELHVRIDEGTHVHARLRLDADRVQVFMEVILPPEYPTDAGRVDLRLRSTNAAKDVLGEMEGKLRSEIPTDGSPALMTLFAEASNHVQDLPLELLAEHFVCCPQCNAVSTEKGLGKLPQPGEVNDGGGGERATSRCLRCGSYDVIPMPYVRVNVVECCSYCFCEDNPLVHLECGCQSCMTCFHTMFSLAAGSKDIRRNLHTKRFGIPCSNHRSFVISDAALMMLGDDRSYARFNHFALETAAKGLDAATCPLADCERTGFPFLTDVKGQLMKCPYCGAYHCASCFQKAAECECETLPPHADVHLSAHFGSLKGSRAAFDVCKKHLRAEVVVTVVAATKTLDKVTLRTDSLDWLDHLNDATFAALHMGGPGFRNELIGAAMFIYAGTPLNPHRPLSDYGLHTGAIIYRLQCFPQRDDNNRKFQVAMWYYRRSDQYNRSLEPAQPKEHGALVAKRCPHCRKQVVHYLGHGCHNIGYSGGSCCGKYWCFGCAGPYPCPNGCPLWCDPAGSCGCGPCPDCQPGRPCVHCSGCPQCAGIPAKKKEDILPQKFLRMADQ